MQYFDVTEIYFFPHRNLLYLYVFDLVILFLFFSKNDSYVEVRLIDFLFPSLSLSCKFDERPIICITVLWGEIRLIRIVTWHEAPMLEFLESHPQCSTSWNTSKPPSVVCERFRCKIL